MAIMTGHGATLAFGTTTTFSPGYTSFSGLGWERDSLQTTTLASVGSHDMIGADLWSIAPVTASYLFDPETLATTGANSIDDLLFDSSAVSVSESITITFASGGSFAANGHVTSFSLEDLGTDQLIAATIGTQWNVWPTVADQV